MNSSMVCRGKKYQVDGNDNDDDDRYREKNKMPPLTLTDNMRTRHSSVKIGNAYVDAVRPCRRDHFGST